MGYLSFYTLTVHSKKSKKIIAQLRAENKEANYSICETGFGHDWNTWYECDEDMKKFSLKHKDVLFEMHREGEGSLDLSKTYYKNGKMQECGAVITYEDFDETKLV